MVKWKLIDKQIFCNMQMVCTLGKYAISTCFDLQTKGIKMNVHSMAWQQKATVMAFDTMLTNT